MKFIPTTKDELKKLNWAQLDIIFISGDSYIDNISESAKIQSYSDSPYPVFSNMSPDTANNVALYFVDDEPYIGTLMKYN